LARISPRFREFRLAEIGKKDGLAHLCERAVAAAHGDDAARQFTPKCGHERRQPKIAAGGPW
jgi:hypothetical protein